MPHILLHVNCPETQGCLTVGIISPTHALGLKHQLLGLDVRGESRVVRLLVLNDDRLEYDDGCTSRATHTPASAGQTRYTRRAAQRTGCKHYQYQFTNGPSRGRNITDPRTLRALARPWGSPEVVLFSGKLSTIKPDDAERYDVDARMCLIVLI
jgi:hypothetical protein